MMILHLFRLCALLGLLWATLAGPAPAATTDAQNNQLLAQVLAQVKPGQKTVFIDDMGFKVGFLRAQRQMGDGIRPFSSSDSTLTRWPGGVVPYVLDGTVTPDDQTTFLTACHLWEAAANVHFIPRTTEANYIVLHSSNGNNSYVGVIGGPQAVNIYNWNFPFIICHELGHALGLIHEQSRSDRDSYVTIATANIPPSLIYNFIKISTSTNTTGYDFDSVMHYGRYDFSVNSSLPTVVVNAPYAAQWATAIGQRTHLSTGDIAGMAQMYGASTGPAAHNWIAKSWSVGADNNIRVLWDDNVGNVAVRLLNPSGQLVTSYTRGPYQGWMAQGVSTGFDNRSRVLWTADDGSAFVHILNSAMGYISQQNYGPFPGWKASSIATGADNYTRLLWTNTDGRASLWNVDVDGNPSGWEFGPYSGWTARSISVGPDNRTHVLWTNADGRASLWTVDGNGNPTGWEFGPFPGYTATAIAVGPDNKTRVLWNNVSGKASLWVVDGNGNPSGWEFGPYPGYTATSLAVGPDNRARLLWDNVNGKASLWSVDPNGTPSGWEFGPY